MIVESPTLISACMMVPSGRFMGGYFSAAPKACLRKRIVLSTPSLMRYGVTFRYPSGILLTMVVPPSLRPERSRFEEEVRTICRGRTPRVYSGAGSRREAKTLYRVPGNVPTGKFPDRTPRVTSKELHPSRYKHLASRNHPFRDRGEARSRLRGQVPEWTGREQALGTRPAGAPERVA